MYSPRGPMSARPMSARQMQSPRGGGFYQPPPGSPMGQSMGSPRSFRPTSAPIRPTSATLRAGGRLYIQSPLEGMSENEMINEARMRIQHNKQRQQLKNLLHASANGKADLPTQDLMLACKIAKMDVGVENAYEADRFVHPSLVTKRDCYGTPRQVDWRGFHKSLPYPELHAPGQFQGDLPMTRRQKQQYKEYQEQLQKMDPDAAPEAQEEIAAVARDEDVRHYHKILKRAMETRFSEIRRAFRLVDMDNSGECDREELKHMFSAMFNLAIPEPIMDRIIDLADYDGDGSINFAEFARLCTEDDVLNMKKTLQADVGAWGSVDLDAKIAEINKAAAAAQRRTAAGGGYEDGGYHPKLRRTGPGLDELRRAHKTIKKAVLMRFPNFVTAFKTIDKDGSGTIRRAELRRFLQTMTKTVGDRVISGLIDFCDDDGDGKTLSTDEFVKLMSAEYLGAGGFDPNQGKSFGKNSRA